MFQSLFSLPLIVQVILAPILLINALGLLLVLAVISRGVYVTRLEEQELRRARMVRGDRQSRAQPVVERIAH